MGTVHSRHSTMNCLVALSCVLAVTHGAAVLPFAGLGYGYGGLHAIPGVAKSTIKYETHGFEPVDVATPADAVKIELDQGARAGDPDAHHLLRTRPVLRYAGHYGVAGLPLVAAPEVKEIELPKIEVPALPYHGLGYGYPYGLGYGYPYTIPVAAPAAAEE